VSAAIEQYIGWDAWLRCEEVEAAEQHSLEQAMGFWKKSISGLATI
jgi:hypothetical protein